MATDILNGKAGVFFKRGTYSGYKTLVDNQQINNDTIYITTDDGGIYLGGKRLGDYVIVDSIANLPSYSAVSTQALYYATKENVLARSNGSGWVQINAAGVTEVSQGAGDIVTSVSVNTNANGTARTLNVTRQNLADNETFKDVADRLSDAEQTLSTLTGGSGTGSLADQIEAAVAPVRQAAAAAQSTADGAVSVNNEQNSTLDDHEERIAANEAAVATVDNRITAAKNAVIGTASDAIGATTVQGALKAAAQAKSIADGAVSVNGEQAAALNDHDTRISANASAIATLNGDKNTAGSVDKKVYDAVAQILNDNDASDIDTLEEIAAWIKNDTAGVGDLVRRIGDAEGDIDDLQGRMSTAETAISTTLPNSINKVKTDLLGDSNSEAGSATISGANKAAAAAQATADEAVRINGEQASALNDHESRISANETAVATTLPNAINAAKNAVLGKSTDAATANTVYGAKAAAAAAQATADGAVAVNTTQQAAIEDNTGRIDNIELTINNHLVWGTF